MLKLADISQSLGYLLPETLLALIACLFLVLEISLRPKNKLFYIFLSSLGFALLLGILAYQWQNFPSEGESIKFKL